MKFYEYIKTFYMWVHVFYKITIVNCNCYCNSYSCSFSNGADDKISNPTEPRTSSYDETVSVVLLLCLII